MTLGGPVTHWPRPRFARPTCALPSPVHECGAPPHADSWLEKDGGREKRNATIAYDQMTEGERECFRVLVSILCRITRGGDRGRGLDSFGLREVGGTPGGQMTGPRVMGIGAGKLKDNRSSRTGSDTRGHIS